MALPLHWRAVLKGLLLTALTPASTKATSCDVAHAARLRRGEAALMLGNADAALLAFEQGGVLGHNPEIQLGMVRSAMQAGRYRQALGFAAHTAGDHAHDPACLATYLWLLELGDQDDFARQVWTQAGVLKWPGGGSALIASNARSLGRRLATGGWHLAAKAAEAGAACACAWAGLARVSTRGEGVQRVILVERSPVH